mmetsp:Transcript_66428/g.138450  ORF Transcript_66428/g.138450 Transcript_66428/m.138450 type:complete len:85 (-) Transcript_66428:92-346(-)|eukprot:CAMPEP_0181327222 /NCGR_PEP_ID=MMETSP1101-20121128/21970_1 /TAXON_ID=46948 /ORGANISM="Rhodomonas abbreviata, Strain Caron Lab Isolate" /LENGTH=84 /DNA_ID=CAMNT_0023435835 /DNA_START=38 /DNA_END=292 /DNA_ORIENTATION=+
MSTPAGKKVLLFPSPSASASESHTDFPSPFLPEDANLVAETAAKAGECRNALLSDLLKDLRGIATSLQDDEWTFETDETLPLPR